MAAKPSKWTVVENDAETAAAHAQRKREKEERRRLKEERTRKSAPQPSPPPVDDTQNDERPSKRRRTSPAKQENGHDDREDLAEFPHEQIGPCGHVNQFEILNKIEEGSYGLVSRARKKASGTLVALKKLKIDQQPGGRFPITGLRDIQSLKASRHVNVVNLQEVVTGDSLKDVYLVMEFVEHDLKTLIDDMDEPFLPSEIKTLVQQLISGVEYLHTNWILHRDLKTSNLLLNNRGELKLADFGMARYTSDPPPKLTQVVTTLWYRAPELLLGAKTYDYEIDIWSVGCIFAELLTKQPLFQGKNEVDQISKIFTFLGTPTEKSWPGFRHLPNAKALHPMLTKSKHVAGTSNLISASKFPHLTSAGLRLLSSTLSMDPTLRPPATELLQHPYFKENPRPKAKAMFPTFPSKANQEKRRREETPRAPVRGENGAGVLDEKQLKGLFEDWEDQERGAGFALRFD